MEKKWYQSASLWVAVASAVSVFLTEAFASGLISNEGWIAVLAPVIALIAKRGAVDMANIKADAIKSVGAGTPTNP